MTAQPLRQWRFPALGTLVTISVAGPSAPARLDAAMAAIEARVHAFGRAAWPWADGALARFNAELAAGRAAAIPESLAGLFAAAWRWRQASGGAFEPRIARLIEVWGFDRIEHLRDCPPPAADIAAAMQALRAAPDWDGGPVHPPAPGIAWDFGAIGKGWIADQVLGWLAEAGVNNALVDLGGHLAASGQRGDRPWRTGIRDPRSPAFGPSALLASVELADGEHIATHGTDQRCFDHAGVRYSHLLDPATGWPAQGLSALTVIAPDGVTADAGGAALFSAGPERWPGMASGLGIGSVLAVGADGRVVVSDALAPRIWLPG